MVKAAKSRIGSDGRPNGDALRMLGVNISRLSLREITSQTISTILHRDRCITFACANPHSLVIAQSDSKFYNALNDCVFVTPDGSGVVLLGRVLCYGVGERITGMDYFASVMSALDQSGGGKVFFLGSTDKVLNRIKHRILREYPNLRSVGVLSPPFGEWSAEEAGDIRRKIRDFSPDILWVGMTAPKQEKWIHENISSLDVPVVGAIGAVFDYYARTNRRAPLWARRLGLEWLFRLIKEPRRLWRRNFISSPVFIVLLLLERFGLYRCRYQ